jgi:hypothetical protein
METLAQLVYVSRSIRLLNDEQLTDLLEKARARNAALSISGLLLYKDLSFIQALEGPEAAIKQVFASISKDPRHHRVKVLIPYSVIQNRDFDGWAMAFQRLSPADCDAINAQEEGYLDAFEVDGMLASQEQASTAIRLLKYFRAKS